MPIKPRSAPGALNTSMYAPGRRRRMSPLMIIGISIPVLLVLIGAGIVVALPKMFSHAAAVPAVPNPNCTLIVPPQALTAKGLATPYQLFAPDAAANGPCNESNVNQSAFVQATIFNPATGTFQVYSPLVIDKGTQPAVVPTAPVLPAGAIVGLWYGYNGTLLTLQGTNAGTLAHANCVNGLNGSVFGQFAYCNSVNFFKSVNAGIAAGKVVLPPLGLAKDGLTCPSTRDFSVVDMDQSDNVQTQYLANGTQIAQLTAANQAKLANAVTLGNPSDNALVTKFIDPALGCTPATAPDLANNGTPTLSMALDELQAANFQKAPIALVPMTDEMVLVNNAASAQKTTLYRVGVDQTPVNANDPATNGSGLTYCQNLVSAAGLTRIKNDMTLTINATSPAPAMANSLFTFLAMRFQQSYMNLGCVNLLKAPNPITLTMANNIVTAATITLPAAAAGAGTTTTGVTCPTATTTTTAAAPTAAATTTTAAAPTAVATTTTAAAPTAAATTTTAAAPTAVATTTTAAAPTAAATTTTAAAPTATTTACTPAQAAAPVTSPAAPVTAGQVTWKNAPYNGVAKHGNPKW